MVNGDKSSDNLLAQHARAAVHRQSAGKCAFSSGLGPPDRQKPEKIKQQVVKRRKFRKIVTTSEAVAECEYRPGKCGKTCQLIILRKNQDVVRGQQLPFKNVRYFFYITSDRKRTGTEMLLFYRERSDHENDIDQLKNGVKAWFGLLLPYRPQGLSIVRMEFKRFLYTFILIPFEKTSGSAWGGENHMK